VPSDVLGFDHGDSMLLIDQTGFNGFGRGMEGSEWLSCPASMALQYSCSTLRATASQASGRAWKWSSFSGPLPSYLGAYSQWRTTPSTNNNDFVNTLGRQVEESSYQRCIHVDTSWRDYERLAMINMRFCSSPFTKATRMYGLIGTNTTMTSEERVNMHVTEMYAAKRTASRYKMSEITESFYLQSVTIPSRTVWITSASRTKSMGTSEMMSKLIKGYNDGGQRTATWTDLLLKIDINLNSTPKPSSTRILTEFDDFLPDNPGDNQPLECMWAMPQGSVPLTGYGQLRTVANKQRNEQQQQTKSPLNNNNTTTKLQSWENLITPENEELVRTYLQLYTDELNGEDENINSPTTASAPTTTSAAVDTKGKKPQQQKKKRSKSSSSKMDDSADDIKFEGDGTFSQKYKFPLRKLCPFTRFVTDKEGGGQQQQLPQGNYIPSHKTGLPQVRVWNWVRANTLYCSGNKTLPDDLWPWWVRCSFRKAIRPWLCNGLDFRKYFWYPLDLQKEVEEMGASIEDYSIYCTLVSRIHWTNILFEDSRLTDEDLNKPISQNQQWVKKPPETIGELYDYLDEMADKEDGIIRPETASKPSDIPKDITFFDACVPSLQRVMHQGELPDLSMLLHMIEWWKDTKDTPHDMQLDPDLYLMCDLIKKAGPNPQITRSLFNLCSRRIKFHPRIAEIVRRMLACSMMGYYEDLNGQVVASLFVRIEIYRWLFYHPATASELATFMNGTSRKDVTNSRATKQTSNKNNPTLKVDPLCLVGQNEDQVKKGFVNYTNWCQFVFNEFLMMMIEQWSGLKESLKLTKWYLMMKEIYGQGMDRARSILNHWLLDYSNGTFVKSTDDQNKVACCTMQRSNTRVVSAIEHMTSASPTSKHRKQPYLTHAEKNASVVSGIDYIQCLCKEYVPWLNWDTLSKASREIMREGIYSRRFQQTVMTCGILGKLLLHPNVMITIEANLYRERQLSLRYATRNTKMGPIESALEEMTRIQVEVIGGEGAPPNEHGYDFPDISEMGVPEKDRELMKSAITVYRNLYWHRKVPHPHPSIYWMSKAFGLDMFPLMMLSLAQHYCSNEAFQMPTSTTTRAMAATHPKEFLYVQTFFRYIQQQANYEVYPLPHQVTKQQRAAIRRRYGLATPDDVDPHHEDWSAKDEVLLQWLSRMYFCAYHLDLKHVLEDEGKMVSPNVRHHGVTNIVINPDTGEMCCRFREVNYNPKRATTTVPHPAPHSPSSTSSDGSNPMDDEKRRIFAHYETKLDTINCLKNPLMFTSGIGFMLRLGNNKYMLCPMCAGFCRVTMEKFDTPRGFLCSRCSTEEKKKNPNAYLPSSDSKSLKPPQQFHCDKCGINKTYPSQKLAYYRVFDDLILPPRFRMIFLCEDHNRSFFSMTPDIMVLSNLYLHFGKRLRPTQDNSQPGVWPSIPSSDDNDKPPTTIHLVPYQSEQSYNIASKNASRKMFKHPVSNFATM
jgi:hypothetical protein